jgi:hypothetical protein
VGPLLLYMNDTVQHLGITFFFNKVLHLYKNYPRNHPVVHKKRDVQAITAAALLISKNLFKECGGFYEEYKNGFEDVDLCLQIKKQGKKMRCVSESVVYHLESQTPGRNAHEKANAKILVERWGDSLRYDAHVHAQRDKYKPVVDDTLSLAFLLEDKESAELLKEAQNRPFRWIHDKLAENPGWIQGAEMLKDMAESYGDMDTALYYADLKISKYVNYAEVEQLLRFALLARNEEIVDYAKNLLAILRRKYTGSPCSYELLLKSHLRRAFDQSDKFLLALIEDKLAYVRERAFPAPENPRYPKY